MYRTQRNQTNEFYQNPQCQILSNNIIYQPQPIISNNQYDLVPQPQQPFIVPFEGNKLEIPFLTTKNEYCGFIFIIVSVILTFLLVLSIENIFVL